MGDSAEVLAISHHNGSMSLSLVRVIRPISANIAVLFMSPLIDHITGGPRNLVETNEILYGGK